MNTPGRKNVCSKLTIETPEQAVKFAQFIRTVLEHVRIS